MGVESCEVFWDNPLITVSEVDVSLIVSIVQKIWIVGVVEPGVVSIILSSPMPLGHPVNCSEQSEGDISPEGWSQDIEPRPEGSKQLVVRVVLNGSISLDISEGASELDNSMDGESIGPKGECSHSWNCECPPLSVEVGLNVVVEDSVSTPDGFSGNTLSEITGLLWIVVDFIEWRASIALVEP